MVRISRNVATGEEMPLLDTKETAAFLSCCVVTVRSYAQRGRLPGQVIGGRWLFRLDDVQAFQSGMIGRAWRDRPDRRTATEKKAAQLAKQRLLNWP